VIGQARAHTVVDDPPVAYALHQRLEWVIGLLRFVAAGSILLIGPALPNIGPLFVVVLGIFFAGYGALVMFAWTQARSAADRERASRITLAVDIGLVGFALLVFAPDPSWVTYVAGFVVIASGGTRFRTGAILAAASLSLTYVIVLWFRDSTLGLPSAAPIVVLQLLGYVTAGAVFDAVLPELDALRAREHDRYEPILRAQDDAGEAVLMTDSGRAVYWNKAFETLTRYSQSDLARPPDLSELLVGADAGEIGERDGVFDARMRTQDGRIITVEVAQRPADDDNRDRRVWLLRDVTTRERAAAELRDQAFHDPLTGLANRALLLDRLRSAIAVAQRQEAPLSLLMLDLDRFKSVNDTRGHHAGDMVLVEIAARLTGTLRESDTAARLGGDEFVLMLPTTPLVGAIEASRALVDFVSAPINVDGMPLTVGASIGIAVFPNHGRDADVLLAAADSAMYEAKHSGGGYRAFHAHLGTTQP
jgi:diguanylate cyclase (GGDEF)-like protein/PAS domain S-box-containing protein